MPTEENWQEFKEYLAAYEKAKQTPAYLELEKSIAEKQAALKRPRNYKELDSREDRAWLACREAGISQQSYYRWRKELAGLRLIRRSE